MGSRAGASVTPVQLGSTGKGYWVLMLFKLYQWSCNTFIMSTYKETIAVNFLHVWNRQNCDRVTICNFPGHA